MSKKDYILIAKVLVDNYDESCERQFWVMVGEFGIMFARNNPSYKHDVFVKNIKARI